MKLRDKRCLLMLPLVLFAGVLLFFLCSESFAAEKLTPGRKLWDNIMLLVNFGILVFIFLRYARKPLMDFLRGVRQKIEKNLDAIYAQFKDAKSGMDAEAEKFDKIEQHVEKLQESIIEMGKREKENIIEQANLSAEKMIEDVKSYAGYQIAKAKKALSDDMVDIAISMVEERLRKGISEEDNEKLVKQFVINLESSKRDFN